MYIYIYIDVGNSLENPKMQEHHLQMGEIMRYLGCTPRSVAYRQDKEEAKESRRHAAEAAPKLPSGNETWVGGKSMKIHHL